MQFFHNKLVEPQSSYCRKEIDIHRTTCQYAVLPPAQVVGHADAHDHFDEQAAYTPNKQHPGIFKILFECFLVKSWDIGYAHSLQQMYKKQRALSYSPRAL